MGKKRKHSDRDSDEKILRQLRRLEEKIRRRKRSSSSEYSSDYENENYRDAGTKNTYYSPNDQYSEDLSPQRPVRLPDIDIGSPREPSENYEKQAPSEEPQQPSTSNADPKTTGDIGEDVVHLDEEILTLLGDAPKETSAVGPDIHIDIASRLKDVLLNGLKKELKEKITEEYPVPGNCSLFKAPILNPEVKAAVSDLLQKKDSSLAARQGQIGVALSALARAMDMLVAEKSDFNQDLIKHISNASRILCDSHHIDTRLRKNFLLSTLNNKIKDTLKEEKRDKHLFGEELGEKLKATKAITKSSQDLKFIKPKSTIYKNVPSSSTSANLNWKHPQLNLQTPNRRPAPINHRTAGATSMYHQRSRPEVDNRRRQPAARARATAPYKKRQ